MSGTVATGGAILDHCMVSSGSDYAYLTILLEIHTYAGVKAGYQMAGVKRMLDRVAL